MLQPAWLRAGITSRRKLTGLGVFIPSTMTVALAESEFRAMITAVPSPTGVTRPWGETTATC